MLSTELTAFLDYEKYVRAKDKSTVMNELKRVYNAASPAEAEAILYDFMVKYSKIYPKAVAVLEDLTSLFEFFEFPAVIRRSIYTTNLIEAYYPSNQINYIIVHFIRL